MAKVQRCVCSISNIYSLDLSKAYKVLCNQITKADVTTELSTQQVALVDELVTQIARGAVNAAKRNSKWKSQLEVEKVMGKRKRSSAPHRLAYDTGASTQESQAPKRSRTNPTQKQPPKEEITQEEEEGWIILL